MNDQDIRVRLEDMARRTEEMRSRTGLEADQARDQFDTLSDSLRETLAAVHHGVALADSGEETVRAEVDGYGAVRHVEISPRSMHEMDCRALSDHCSHAMKTAALFAELEQLVRLSAVELANQQTDEEVVGTSTDELVTATVTNGDVRSTSTNWQNADSTGKSSRGQWSKRSRTPNTDRPPLLRPCSRTWTSPVAA